MRGARTIRRGEEGWPTSLEALSDPPGFLRVRGRLPEAHGPAVSVVGARGASPRGLREARAIGAALARAGAWVVSGGAVGVDAAAHAGALEAGGRTLVVLGGGLDHLYPAENRELFARVVESGGGLLAEVEDDVRAATWSFPRRNRIVAALSRATVVVRAGASSGALLTAREAVRVGTPVWVASGVEGAEGDGLRALEAGGAERFRSTEHLLAGLGLTLPESGPVTSAPPPEGVDARLWGALDGQPRGADEVGRSTGMGAAAVMAGLTELELLGLVERRPGRGFARREVGPRGE